jgi:hypothetical protein
MPSTTRLNLIWVIGVLVAINAGLLLRLADGSSVTAYISFAASIASLILAVVAIFYSIISNQNLSGTIERLKEISGNIERTSSGIEDASKDFCEKSNLLMDGLSAVPSSVERMAGDLGSRLDLLSSNSLQSPTSDRNVEPKENLRGATLGLFLALYVIVLSKKANKAFDTDQIFKQKLVADYVTACITTLAVCKHKDIEVSFVRRNFQTISTGKLNSTDIIHQVENSNKKGVKPLARIINTYFGLETAIDDDSEEPQDAVEATEGSNLDPEPTPESPTTPA